jgi:dihydromethanopterin reductase (acceptor)
MSKAVTPRWGWALTGSGHFFNEFSELMRQLEHVDLFVSKAADEVLRQYKQKHDLPKTARVYKDTAATSPQVGYFYHGVYHTLVVAPATSNIVAQVPGSFDCLCLRYRAGAFDPLTRRHRESLSAADRS